MNYSKFGTVFESFTQSPSVVYPALRFAVTFTISIVYSIGVGKKHQLVVSQRDLSQIICVYNFNTVISLIHLHSRKVCFGLLLNFESSLLS